MSSFGEQLRAAQQAHHAVGALEDAVRQEVAAVFAQWERGALTNQEGRTRLEGIVRTAYRTSSAVAASHAARQSGLPGWTPPELPSSKYLRSLLFDVRRNLREFRRSEQTEKDRRQAILRIQHSAGVAAQRGYTDALIEAYAELEDFGFELRKLWMANFVNNTPCEQCSALHGTEVGLHEEFPTGEARLKVYGDLKGPPRHPRCRCYLAILIVTLENALEPLDERAPTSPPQTMTTDEVQEMPNRIFQAVVKVLQKVITFVKGRRRG